FRLDTRPATSYRPPSRCQIPFRFRRAATGAGRAGARPTKGGAMTHPIPSVCRAGRTPAGWLLAAALLGAAGCSQVMSRGQVADEVETKFDLKQVQTVGDVVDVAN